VNDLAALIEDAAPSVVSGSISGSYVKGKPLGFVSPLA
jgi:hypothetical protein